MIDIHTHILPDLDDGAKNKEEAIEILQMLQAQGVLRVAFTPHYYGKKCSVEEFLTAREKAFIEIQDAIPNGLDVLLGAEVHLSGINDPSDERLCELAISGTKCVLVELPFFGKWSKTLFERLGDFVFDTGYTPIVAHIERYDAVRKTPSVVQRLIDAGCLVQVNTRAFYDKRTKRLAFSLLKKNMVHFLGTDAHDLVQRKPDYALAKQTVFEKGYQNAWERVQENMIKVLADERIDIKYKPFGKIFGIYF